MQMLRTIPALPVKNVRRSIPFYDDTLGFVLAHEEDGFAILRRDDAEIHLWAASDDSWRQRSGSEPVISGAETFIAGTASCRIEVNGVDELHQEIYSRGVLGDQNRIIDQPFGAREFNVFDPDNNLITFFERV
jgi:catechol 2,3-dioxygenase-like lactoylglutathione lyase family enzyme